MKMSSLFTINLAEKMRAENRRELARTNSVIQHQQNLDAEVKKLIGESTELMKEGERIDAMKTLGLNYHLSEMENIKLENSFFARLPQENIFTHSSIEKICKKYGLRFLPTSLYRGSLDENIPAKLEELKKMGNFSKLLPESFYIAAPKESFELQNRPVDPLLFYYVGFGKYYLIHKWGNDISVTRQIKTWFKVNTWVYMAPMFPVFFYFCSLGAMKIAHDHFIAIIFSIFFGAVGCFMFTAFLSAIGIVGNENPLRDTKELDNWKTPFKN